MNEALILIHIRLLLLSENCHFLTIEGLFSTRNYIENSHFQIHDGPSLALLCVFMAFTSWVGGPLVCEWISFSLLIDVFSCISILKNVWVRSVYTVSFFNLETVSA